MKANILTVRGGVCVCDSAEVSLKSVSYILKYNFLSVASVCL